MDRQTKPSQELGADHNDKLRWMCDSCGHTIPVNPIGRTPAVRCAKCRASAWSAVTPPDMQLQQRELPPTKELSVRNKFLSLAREACRKYPQAKAAAKWMRGELMRDKELMADLLEPMIHQAIQAAVQIIRHRNKTHLKESRGLASIESVAATIERGLLKSWVLPNGKYLGKANRDELVKFADESLENARGMFANANFYRAIADKTREGATVDQCVNESEATELWRQAREGHKLDEPQPIVAAPRPAVQSVA